MPSLGPVQRTKRKDALIALLPPGFGLRTGYGQHRVWIYQEGAELFTAAGFKSIDLAIKWLQAFTKKVD